MQTHRLDYHPAFPPQEVAGVEVRISQSVEGWLNLRWKIDGSAKLILPKFSGKARADNLWQATCFELFVKPSGGAAYSEFNFSPSEQWAAYDFTGEREGMADRPIDRAPIITPRVGQSKMIFDVALARDALGRGALNYSLTAILEEEGGVKSYWAMSHALEKPDFHDASCFTATLAAPEAP